MRIYIFDVGHGFCAMVTGPNGKRLLIDCGTRSDPFWSPSLQFYGEPADALLIANLDADHVTNYSYVRGLMQVKTVWINNTIDAAKLASLKRDGGMSAGVQALYQDLLWHPEIFNVPVDLSPMRVWQFRFPYGRFTNTNNLSLITFVEYAGFCILFPGDLEKDAWRALLADPPPGFLELLARVRLYVCSHHGRENGCCETLFPPCRPDAFIFSDKEKEHETQETANWYARRALGLPRILQTPWEQPETRYVFTTRTDKCLDISVQPNGSYVLWTNSQFQKDFSIKPEPPRITMPTPPPGIRGALAGLGRSNPSGMTGLSGIGRGLITQPSISLSALLSPRKPR